MAVSNPQSTLADLDYSVVQQCMHCGLCLPSCPTYDATRLERESPRGRIALLRAVAEGRMEVTSGLADTMSLCLGCLACTTACPAGVDYGDLFEHGRAAVESAGIRTGTIRNGLRWFFLRWLFADLERLRWVGRALWYYQELGLQTAIRRSGILRLLPRRLQELEAMAPVIQEQAAADLLGTAVVPAQGPRRYRVAVLTGCAQDLIFSDVNRDTVEVLVANGCEVVMPREQSCCGSIHAHNGDLDQAQVQARRNLAQFPAGEFDAIISNAAGCGSHLRHYARLLKSDPVWHAHAVEWDAKVRDISEWLVEIGFRKPRAPVVPPGAMDADEVNLRVTYHEACHLCHGQKITRQPREVLKALPGIDCVELTESTWCCGSAGVYNLLQPEMATELLDRKVRRLRESAAGVVATANPGCLLQVQNGCRRAGLELRVVHPITLLAEAYRAED